MPYFRKMPSSRRAFHDSVSALHRAVTDSPGLKSKFVDAQADDSCVVVCAPDSDDGETSTLGYSRHLCAQRDGVLTRVLPLDPDPIHAKGNVCRRHCRACGADDLPERRSATAHGQLEIDQSRVASGNVGVLLHRTRCRQRNALIESAKPASRRFFGWRCIVENKERLTCTRAHLL